MDLFINVNEVSPLRTDNNKSHPECSFVLFEAEPKGAFDCRVWQT